MKKAKIALIMSASCLLALGMAACGGHTAASSVLNSSTTDTSSSTSAAATVTKITAPDIPLVKVGAELDLDTVIIVTTSDGATTSKDFTVTCSNTAVTLTGHVFKATAPGSFELTVTAGGKSIKPTVEVKTETGMGLINFFKTLEKTPQNYTLTLLKYDSASKSIVYDGETLFHNEKYIAAYDVTNPGSVDSDGNANSVLLATLADGKAYWGSLDTKGKPVFAAGSVSYSDYYITNDLAVDGNAFVSTIDDAGTESIAAPSAVTTAIINSGFGSKGPTGYTIGATEVLGATDADKDGVFEDVSVALYVSKDGKDYLYQILTIEKVGATTVDFMETAITDMAYVPAAVKAPEITTEFAAVNTAAAYTTTIEMYPAADAKGTRAVTATVAAAAEGVYAYKYFFGDTGVGYERTATITADGVIATMNETTTTADSAGALTTTKAVSNKVAYFNRDSKGYKAIMGDDKSTMTTTVLDNVADVWGYAAAKLFSVEGITDAAVTGQEWTKKTTDEKTGVITIEGSIGDDKKTEKTNTLFAQIFNQLGFFGFGTSGTPFGTIFSAYQDFSADKSGNYHALTISSDWTFVINPTTKDLTLTSAFRIPYGTDNDYMGLSYTISAVGSTTNDFSAFVPASTTTSSSANA